MELRFELNNVLKSKNIKVLCSIVLVGMVISLISCSPPVAKDIPSHSPIEPPTFAVEEQLTDAKKADIQKLLSMTGAVKVGQQFADMLNSKMLQNLRASNPYIPDRAIVIMEEEMNRAFNEESAKNLMKETICRIYHKYFSHSEIKQMIEFYKTPLGQKTIRVMPGLTQESVLAGQRAAQSIVPKVLERMRQRFDEEGIVVK